MFGYIFTAQKPCVDGNNERALDKNNKKTEMVEILAKLKNCSIITRLTRK